MILNTNFNFYFELFYLSVTITAPLSCETSYDLISSNEYEIPDSAITASSTRPAKDPYKSRLGDSGWIARTEEDEWIQADLGSIRIVTAM